MSNQFQRALKRLHLFRVETWSSDSSDPKGDHPTAVSDLMVANIISSKHNAPGDPLHDVVIDIDLPVKVIESTNGNTHLFIEHDGIPQDQYFALLDALAGAGIVQPGYVRASKERGYTAVRLPWIVKDTVSGDAA